MGCKGTDLADDYVVAHEHQGAKQQLQHPGEEPGEVVGAGSKHESTVGGPRNSSSRHSTTLRD